MSWPAAAGIATLAIVPFIALVLYLIIRPTPAQTALAQGAAPDLISDAEDQQYADAAEGLRARKSQEVEAAAVIVDPDPIDWEDAEKPYRPDSIDVVKLAADLKLSATPTIGRDAHHVFIAKATLEQIEKHLSSDTRVELGGLLIGRPYYAPVSDAYLIVVHEAFAAGGGLETPTSFEYTADTWRDMTPRLQQLPAEYVVVGSYHSHPNLGVFLSATDIDTQAIVFAQEWQIALVIDPIRNETGFFISDRGVPVKYDVF